MRTFRSWALPAGAFVIGLLCLFLGLLPWANFSELARRTIPILLFVLAMTVITELADDAGLFRVLTSRLARWTGGREGRGRVLALWLVVVLLATLSTVFLSLDTTAVLVTPVVVLLALHARIAPLPFALTTVWLANTASLLLPVSNLTNLLAQHALDVTPWQFLGLLWAPALLGIALPVLFVWLLFRYKLDGKFSAPNLETAPDRRLLILCAVVVTLLLPALISGIPVEYPALLAAGVLLLAFVVRRRETLRWRILPAKPLLLTMGLFLVVETLQVHGLPMLLSGVAGRGEGLFNLLQLSVVGAGTANLANNLPAYLALEPTAQSPLRLAALLIGVNLGPLVTPWASLATLLWHERLKALGVSVPWFRFAILGLILAVVLLPLSVLALWLSAGLPG
ncbi:SLC13 family permease [Psychromicrobium lacuslunae]|uniref:Arsenic transporter n=1 Tax=Psychromicrobium lacuslunae TaxID=1618207 RepID=A0A0D4C0D7_9MICC|nr:SLC13 family permease [Psychromicrobium lacuslunae]AJT41831.1 arsenic transporter [Psychromicrobium lacuslunae]